MRRLLNLLCLASLVWLAGCASTNPGSSSASSSDTATSGDATAHYPEGPLRPITSGLARGHAITGIDAPQDLWERIRGGFSMPDLESDLVVEREQWYASRPDYMQRMTERSSKYLFYIVEELELRGMPSELALLPYIESAFNPQAVSSAKAAGMWQFMPATGNYFDLKQNAFRDDRRDVLASTRAALDYLQKLYGMFGDWHLALAAYNWGEGSVQRAMARNQKQGLGTRYTELSMPAETRMYVPKLQAIKNIIARPEQFQAVLPSIGNHPYFQTVDITRDIDVALVARLADVEEADFRALNPSLHKPVILAAGMPQILLPWDNAQVFRRNLQAYDEGQYASWTVWAVPTTMTVAAAAQHAGMSVADLRAINAIPPGMMIKAGSALMVARAQTMRKDVSSHLADNGQIAFTPEVATRRTTVRARKGENTTTLAKRYRVTPAQVAQWNGVRAGSAFKTGQQLVVYLPLRAAASVAKGTPSKTAVASTAARRPAATAKAPQRKRAAAASTTVASKQKR